MSRVPEFTECVAVTAYATRAADLEEAALRVAACAFEG